MGESSPAFGQSTTSSYGQTATSYGQSPSTHSPTALLRAKSAAKSSKKSDDVKYEEMGRQVSTARKSIVCFVVVGIVAILVGLIMYIQPSNGLTSAGITIMVIGVLVIICGV